MPGDKRSLKETPWALPSCLAEATWLAAVVVIPVAADLQSYPIFTAPKVAVTQVFGILSALALALQALDTHGRRGCFGKNPGTLYAVAAAALLVILSFVSWNLALDPTRIGDSEDVSSLGPMHLGCQVALFLSVAFFLRTSAQLERLALAGLAAAFAVAGFTLLQTYGFQAPGYAVVEGMKITSFVGGPIFLGGYLLMLLPIAVWNLHRQLVEARGAFSYRVAVGALVLLALGGAFLACGKRGPIIGFAGMGCSALVLLAIRTRHRTLLVKASAAALVVAVALTGLALLQKSGVPLNRIPFVERLAMIVPVGGETGDTYRSYLWALLPGLMLSGHPATLPSGMPDQHHALRRWLGFGPDNAQTILPSKYIFLQAWPSDVMEVSCHSHFWDLALSLGAAGVVVFFGLFFAVWYQGLPKIGAHPPPPTVAVFVAFGSALAGGFAGASIFHPGFFGIGAQAGFLVGLLGIGLLDHTNAAPPTGSDDSGRKLLLLAMMSGLAGHWIDLGFIFPTAENGIVFWLFAGAVVGWKGDNKSCHEEDGIETSERTIWAAWVGSALLAAGIYARVFMGPVLAGQLGLGDLFGDTTATALLAGLGLATMWAVCHIFSPTDGGRCLLPKLQPPCRVMVAAAAAYLAGVFWLGRFMLWFPPTPDRPLLADIWAVHFLLLIAAGALTVALVVAARRHSTAWITGVAGLLVAAACVVMWIGPAQDMRSSVSAGAIRYLPHAGRWLERSISLRPEQTRNYLRLANLLVDEGMNADPEKRDELLRWAEKILRQGIGVSNFNLLGAKLGRLYLRRALRTDDMHEKEDLAQRARDLLQAAVWFAPQNEPAWVDAALVERELFRDGDKAKSMLRAADAVTLFPPPGANVVMESWGRYYTGQARAADTEEQRQHYAERALMYMRLRLGETDLALIELERNGDPPAHRIDVLMARAESLACMGVALRMLGREDEAKAATEEMDGLLKEAGGITREPTNRSIPPKAH